MTKDLIRDIEGFVLIGGLSSRMGTDKSALTIAGESFVARATAALSGIAETIRLVGGNVTGSVKDIYENWGAFGGLHAALTSAQTKWAAVLACDLPFVTSGLLQRLTTLREGFDAVAPIQADGRAQPLCALYSVETCRQVATELIESGERRPIALLQSVRTRWVPFNELADLDGSASFFDNINTPGDYGRAKTEGDRRSLS